MSDDKRKDEGRRTFLKLAGITAAGGVGVPLIARALGPAAKPARLARYAMLIDTRRCLQKDGCKECIAACHRTHNVPDVSRPVKPEYQLPEKELVKREIKWIWKEPFEHAFPDGESPYTEEGLKGKELMVFCNHCDNPPCVRVCPTKATWKRAKDGVVMMDMHRCIGCRYCVVACPYGSRSFNWTDPRKYLAESEINMDYPTRMKGVVEKCNFCEERVAEGLQPACVAACPQRAMVFGNLEDPSSEARRLLRARFSIRRRPGLGTDPQVYYLV
jgi:molybdopterin-containing oxidoreductase family iron-sulfur binding subunit